MSLRDSLVVSLRDSVVPKNDMASKISESGNALLGELLAQHLLGRLHCLLNWRSMKGEVDVM